VSAIVPPVCADDQIRRALVIARSDLNGIDYIDVDPANHASLTVYFLKPVPPLDPVNPNDTDDAYGLSGDLAKITFSGGTRIVGIQPVAAARNPDGSIVVTASKPGDFRPTPSHSRCPRSTRCSPRSISRSWRPARSRSTAGRS
jgi:hypothetical protein